MQEIEKYLPIFVALEGRRCIVVGGGAVAARKVAYALRFGAQVTVIAPELAAGLARDVEQGILKWVKQPYRRDLLDGAGIVFAATNDEAVNAAVAADATAAGVLVNVADSPALCSFILPSIVDRSPVVVAVSSGGQAPVLARTLRARLETSIPARFGDLASLMGELRETVKQQIPDATQRRRFWEHVVHGPVAETLFAGRAEGARQQLMAALADTNSAPATGEVYLVGAGPGDPDLLTFRALRLMQQADVVLYDRLVAAPLLDLVRRDAERVYVGKARDRHAVPQEDINRLLVDYAKAGHRVLRLKGGDPFMFGRGGEEIESLAEQGIPFQIVPGITAALGCASYAGIPLTHRDFANSCTFVTAHMRDDRFDLNWPALVQPRQTLAIYMGVHGLDRLCGNFIEHGLAPTMPAALVEKGTTPAQRVITGTLTTLPALARQSEVEPPALLIIGEVVTLREKLAWFDQI
ncbi:MAG: uroporphyrinogen-III C-methyltransferase [Gammaproteobacteria bacterium]|nr:uroporphyrinogen-III C-methyltransferase [Gammaproteobacteria bacterium]